MQATIEKILECKVIAIVRGLEPKHMRGLASALSAGGISAMEVTFNQAKPETFSDTQAAIRLLSEEFSGKLIVGAGTVLSPEQVDLAADAGAKYIISPNVSAAVIGRTKELGLVSMPGAFTPTEIVAAHDAGADFVKVFPAGSLGSAYIKAIRAPISHIRMMAVGGVDEKNAADFLRAGCCGIGVGGSLVNKSWIEEGAFDKIEALARTYTEVVRACK